MATQVLPPETSTQTSHGLSIRVGGVTIGAINGWNPAITRGIAELYEFGTVTGLYEASNGAPYEKVPNNVSGMTVQIQRYDLWTARMEQVFGTGDITMLSNQRAPFEVREVWVQPSNAQYAKNYRGCWFSNVGRNLSTTAERVVQVSATLEYTKVEEVPV